VASARSLLTGDWPMLAKDAKSNKTLTFKVRIGQFSEKFTSIVEYIAHMRWVLLLLVFLVACAQPVEQTEPIKTQTFRLTDAQIQNALELGQQSITESEILLNKVKYSENISIWTPELNLAAEYSQKQLTPSQIEHLAQLDEITFSAVVEGYSDNFSRIIQSVIEFDDGSILRTLHKTATDIKRYEYRDYGPKYWTTMGFSYKYTALKGKTFTLKITDKQTTRIDLTNEIWESYTPSAPVVVPVQEKKPVERESERYAQLDELLIKLDEQYDSDYDLMLSTHDSSADSLRADCGQETGDIMELCFDKTETLLDVWNLVAKNHLSLVSSLKEDLIDYAFNSQVDLEDIYQSALNDLAKDTEEGLQKIRDMSSFKRTSDEPYVPQKVVVQPPKTQGIMVTRVIDGDTIEINTGERVRLIGINTPEVGEDCYEEAKEELENVF